MLYSKARNSAIDSVRHLIEVGHRLAELKKSLRRKFRPWLKANEAILGFKKTTAYYLLNAAASVQPAGHSELEITNEQAVLLRKTIWGHEKRDAKAKTNNKTKSTKAQKPLAPKLPNPMTTGGKIVAALKPIGDTGITLERLHSEHFPGVPKSTISGGAWTSLREQGWVVDTGKREPTSTGKPATVWRFEESPVPLKSKQQIKKSEARTTKAGFVDWLTDMSKSARLNILREICTEFGIRIVSNQLKWERPNDGNDYVANVGESDQYKLNRTFTIGIGGNRRRGNVTYTVTFGLRMAPLGDRRRVGEAETIDEARTLAEKDYANG